MKYIQILPLRLNQNDEFFSSLIHISIVLKESIEGTRSPQEIPAASKDKLILGETDNFHPSFEIKPKKNETRRQKAEEQKRKTLQLKVKIILIWKIRI